MIWTVDGKCNKNTISFSVASCQCFTIDGLFLRDFSLQYFINTDSYYLSGIQFTQY